MILLAKIIIIFGLLFLFIFALSIIIGVSLNWFDKECPKITIIYQRSMIIYTLIIISLFFIEIVLVITKCIGG
jgi:hypothetical protein